MVEKIEHSVLRLIHNRSTADNFDTTRSLTVEEIRQLVADATRAPSSFNIQHWRFVAVREAEGKERLRQACFGQQQVSRAAVTFIILGDIEAVEKLPEILRTAVECGAMAEGKAEAWVRMAQKIYAHGPTARDEAIRSASLAAMTMMLAAEARGLAAGALTGFDPARVKSEFGIGERYVPVILVTVGYPVRSDAARMPRLDVSDVLALDRWADPERRET